ncbi:MAG: hypothetical protein KatS3mg061_1338 [Dehalococcoidia bacterium]|nr:MAG: hypothetical protein KatS3mg061_1338 [Dehalococcoidia bacterium]
MGSRVVEEAADVLGEHARQRDCARQRWSQDRYHERFGLRPTVFRPAEHWHQRTTAPLLEADGNFQVRMHPALRPANDLER